MHVEASNPVTYIYYIVLHSYILYSLSHVAAEVIKTCKMMHITCTGFVDSIAI